MSYSHPLKTSRGKSLLACLLFLSVASLKPVYADQASDALQPPYTNTLSQSVGNDTAFSRKPFYLQTQLAAASESDFGPAVLFYYKQPDQRTALASVSVGRHLSDNLFGWPAEVVAYGSLQYYDERGYQPDAIGTAVYIKAYKHYTVGKSQTPVRIGLGEGLSYASRIPVVEAEDFAPDTSAKLTNYLEWTVQTSLSHLLGHGTGRFSASIRDIHIGYSVFHRSTVFGLFASKGGGVNFMGISLELVLD